MSERRVVVTGLGPVTPLGVGREAFWRAALEGTDCSHEVERFDTSMYKVHRACEVRGFEAPALEGGSGPAARLATAAARLALEDAGLSPGLERCGVVFGTTGGEIPVLEGLHRLERAEGEDALPRDEFLHYPCHRIAAQVGRALALEGPNQVVPTACAAGNYALATARDWLRDGRCERVVAGGVDPLSIVTFTGFGRMFAIAPDHCRPFDKNRKGILPGEGAAALVLETLEGARARGATILAEVRGVGFSCDAHHPTMPHPEGVGIQLAMRRALSDAACAPEAVDYVSAHGTGTPANDRIESAAIHAVFGAHAAKLPVSSMKSMIGHTMGAASAIEACACVQAIQEGAVPPTIHHEEPDPECAIDVVPNVARELPVEVALNNAWAFGGNNCCVLFGKVEA